MILCGRCTWKGKTLPGDSLCPVCGSEDIETLVPSVKDREISAPSRRSSVGTFALIFLGLVAVLIFAQNVSLARSLRLHKERVQALEVINSERLDSIQLLESRISSLAAEIEDLESRPARLRATRPKLWSLPSTRASEARRFHDRTSWSSIIYLSWSIEITSLEGKTIRGQLRPVLKGCQGACPDIRSVEFEVAPYANTRVGDYFYIGDGTTFPKGCYSLEFVDNDITRTSTLFCLD